MSSFYTNMLFEIQGMFPKYLMDVKETGEIPSFFPSPISGAEETIKFIFEQILSPGHVEETESGRWTLTSKGEAVLRGMKPGASDGDLYALNRAING